MAGLRQKTGEIMVPAKGEKRGCSRISGDGEPCAKRSRTHPVLSLELKVWVWGAVDTLLAQHKGSMTWRELQAALVGHFLNEVSRPAIPLPVANAHLLGPCLLSLIPERYLSQHDDQISSAKARMSAACADNKHVEDTSKSGKQGNAFCDLKKWATQAIEDILAEHSGSMQWRDLQSCLVRRYLLQHSSNSRAGHMAMAFVPESYLSHDDAMVRQVDARRCCKAAIASIGAAEPENRTPLVHGCRALLKRRWLLKFMAMRRIASKCKQHIPDTSVDTDEDVALIESVSSESDAEDSLCYSHVEDVQLDQEVPQSLCEGVLSDLNRLRSTQSRSRSQRSRGLLRRMAGRHSNPDVAGTHDVPLESSDSESLASSSQDVSAWSDIASSAELDELSLADAAASDQSTEASPSLVFSPAPFQKVPKVAECTVSPTGADRLSHLAALLANNSTILASKSLISTAVESGKTRGAAEAVENIALTDFHDSAAKDPPVLVPVFKNGRFQYVPQAISHVAPKVAEKASSNEAMLWTRCRVGGA